MRALILLGACLLGCGAIAGLETPSFFDATDPADGGSLDGTNNSGGDSSTPTPTNEGGTPVVDAGDASTGADAGFAKGAQCGQVVCGQATPVCCSATTTCIAPQGLDCITGIKAQCDGPEDCPGQVCCLEDIGREAKCAADCQGITKHRACHVDGDCTQGTCGALTGGIIKTCGP